MESKYEVVFYGTDATGDEALEIMQRVGNLLKLDEQQIVNLFDQPSGITLLTTRKKTKAERLLKALLRTGASCNLRNTDQQKGDWESWGLEEKAEDLYNVFQCRACNYAERLPVASAVYGVCPQCGVVQSKYEDVTQRKLERERLRRKILNVQEAKAKQLEDERAWEREEKLRKEIEKEIRREMQLQRGFGLDAKSMAAATAVFAIGVGSAVAYYTFENETDATTPAIAETRQVINRPTMGMTSAQTIYLANDLLERLGATPLTDARVSGNFIPDRTVPSSDLLASTNSLAEPWINAPATAAGPRRAMPERSAADTTTPQAVDAASSENAAAQIIDSWYTDLERDPMRSQYLGKLLNSQQDVSELIAAQDIARIANSPKSRVTLIAHLASTGKDFSSSNATEYMSIAIRESDSLEAKAAAVLAKEVLHEKHNLGPPQGLNQELARLFSMRSEGSLDQLRAQAFIAAVYGSDGDLQEAQFWFSQANDTLNAITEPHIELLALPSLAMAYMHANDIRTAHKLVERVRIGLPTLPESTLKPQIVAELIKTYAAIGMMDQAAHTARSTTETRLQAETVLARLAVSAAQNEQIVSAQGILSVIHDAALKAHAKAQISAIAHFINRPMLAREFADAARQDSRSLESPLAQVVASQLLTAYRLQGWDDTSAIERISTAPLSGVEVRLADRARILIATNFAWAGDLALAKRVIAPIDKLSTRQKADDLLKRIEALRSVQIKTPQSIRTAAR